MYTCLSMGVYALKEQIIKEALGSHEKSVVIKNLIDNCVLPIQEACQVMGFSLSTWRASNKGRDPEILRLVETRRASL